jgi:hypothetical protein
MKGQTTRQLTVKQQRRRLFGIAQSVVFIGLLTALAFWLSRSSEPTAESIVIAKALDDQFQPIDPTDSYNPEDDTFFVSVVLKNYYGSPPVVAVWRYEGQIIEETNLLTSGQGNITAGFSLVNSNPPWQAGKYAVDIVAGQTVLASKTFMVKQNDP